MTNPYPAKPLWVIARRPSSDTYLLSDGEQAYITYRMRPPQGTTKVVGPMPLERAARAGWIYFEKRYAFRGPLRGLTRDELARRRGGA